MIGNDTIDEYLDLSGKCVSNLKKCNDDFSDFRNVAYGVIGSLIAALFIASFFVFYKSQIKKCCKKQRSINAGGRNTKAALRLRSYREQNSENTRRMLPLVNSMPFLRSNDSKLILHANSEQEVPCKLIIEMSGDDVCVKINNSSDQELSEQHLSIDEIALEFATQQEKAPNFLEKFFKRRFGVDVNFNPASVISPDNTSVYDLVFKLNQKSQEQEASSINVSVHDSAKSGSKISRNGASKKFARSATSPTLMHGDVNRSKFQNLDPKLGDPKAKKEIHCKNNSSGAGNNYDIKNLDNPITTFTSSSNQSLNSQGSNKNVGATFF